jgi:DNA-binding NarL/FixJ family response regulator
MKPISVLIADDHQLLREVWIMLLNSNPNFTIVAACETGQEAVEKAQELSPDVVLMDINLPEVDGFEATALIRKLVPGTKVLGVSMHSQLSYVRKMLKMGAHGFVTKNSSAEEMFRAIIEVSKGRKYICAEVNQVISSMMLEDDQDGKQKANWLSIREMEIIDHIKMGYSSKEIAGLLQVSAKTIEAHRYNILRKLNVKNTAALINFVNVSI